MGQEGIAAINDMGNGVDLMGQEFDLRVDTRKDQVAAVIFAGPDAVHFLVVLPHQRLTALGVLPNPIPECFPKGLLLLCCKGGFFPVQYPLFLIVFIQNDIVNADIPEVQGILQDVIGAGAAGAEGGIGSDIMDGYAALAGDGPGGGKFGMVDGHIFLEIGRRFQNFVHKLLDIALVDPVRPQPDLDLGGIQVFGLNSGQSLHIDLESRVLLRRQLSRPEFPAHVSGEIFVRSLPAGKRVVSRSGIFEYHAPQLLRQFYLRLAGELCHKGEVCFGAFPDGHGQGLGRSIYMGDGGMPLDGPLGEHVGLALQPPVLVQHFQGTEQVVGRIFGEGQTVGPVVDEPVLGGKAVIEPVQFCLLFTDSVVRNELVHLKVDQFSCTVPQFYHALDALLRGGGQAGLHHDGVFPIVDIPVHDGKGVIFHSGVGGNH